MIPIKRKPAAPPQPTTKRPTAKRPTATAPLAPPRKPPLLSRKAATAATKLPGLTLHTALKEYFAAKGTPNEHFARQQLEDIELANRPHLPPVTFSKQGRDIPITLSHCPPATLARYLSRLHFPGEAFPAIPPRCLYWWIFRKTPIHSYRMSCGFAIIAPDAEVAEIARALLPQFKGWLILEPQVAPAPAFKPWLNRKRQELGFTANGLTVLRIHREYFGTDPNVFDSSEAAAELQALLPYKELRKLCKANAN